MSAQKWELDDGFELVVQPDRYGRELTDLSLYLNDALVLSIEVEPVGEVQVAGRACGGITKALALTDALRALADQVSIALDALQESAS